MNEKEQERRRKISAAMKGKKKPDHVVVKIAAILKGKKRTNEQNEANRQRAIVYFSNPENREKARQKALEQWSNPGVRERCIAKNRENASNPSTKQSISNAIKKLWENPDYRKVMSDAHIGQKAWNKNIPMTEEYRNNVIAAINKPDVIERKRAKSKALWKNDEYVKKLHKAYNIKPNKPETIILNLLNDLYPNEWKYTGDFSFMINGKNPDFVNCNGQKKLIELFGDYWHEGENPQDRIDIFKPFGYETLVIWEHELKDIKEVKNKIISFNNS
jgi:hypothetical protein